MSDDTLKHTTGLIANEPSGVQYGRTVAWSAELDGVFTPESLVAVLSC